MWLIKVWFSASIPQVRNGENRNHRQAPKPLVANESNAKTMNNKQRVILSVLFGVTIICTIISLFLPYLMKLNICCGDLTLPKMYEGYHYQLTTIILLFIFASVLSLLLDERQITTVIFSAIVLILTWLVRYSIHFQGFIDHDYDSKTGIGYLLLFISVLTHFVVSFSAFILQIRNRESNTTKTK